jgi:hypothetical protein
VVLPYGDPPVEIVLTIAADAARLDVHLSVDTTGSFGEEIDTIQSELLEEVLPAIRMRASEVAVGVSRFEDFPISPFGADGDRPFALLSPITTSEGRVGNAIALLDQPLGHGGDIAEASAEALYQIATGAGLSSGGVRYVDAFHRRPAEGGGTLGGVGFREASLRAVVHVTDAPTHAPSEYLPQVEGAHSLAEATEQLNALNVFVLGIAAGAPARAHLERIALDTGAVVPSVSGVCPTGIDGSDNRPIGSICPLVFDIARDGTGLSDAMADALVALLDAVRFGEVYGVAADDPLGFVEAIEARAARPPVGSPEPGREDRHPPDDGILDTFVDVRPGTEIDLVARLSNTRIRPADYDQVFRVTIEVIGDGLVLRELVVRVTVPRGRVSPDAGVPDAGAPDATDSGRGDADGGIADAGDAS